MGLRKVRRNFLLELERMKNDMRIEKGMVVKCYILKMKM